MPPSIRDATRAELDEVALVATRAFQSDECMLWTAGAREEFGAPKRGATLKEMTKAQRPHYFFYYSTTLATMLVGGC